MRKRFVKQAMALFMAAAMMTGTASTAMAAEWKQDAKGWWWQEDNGSYPASTWKWLDGNKDGVSECYYFDANGYMLTSTTTPDGYTVNADGQWVENGTVKTQGTTTSSSRPSAEEIFAHIYRYRLESDSTLLDRLMTLVDTSKPAWDNGVTNIHLSDGIGSRWTNTHGGWYYVGYDNIDVHAIALNDDGYLLADTTTPDGFYVNKYGILEIDGREVAHSEECLYAASSTPVADKNHVDPNQYRYQDIGIGHSWKLSSFSFGNLIYNHFHGYDEEHGGVDSTIESWNDFGVCVKWK